MINDAIVSRHVEDAAFLWSVRERKLVDNTCSPRQLKRLDDRVDAAVDGLHVAGDAAWPLCKAELEFNEDPGEVFAAAILALREQSSRHIEDVLSVAFKAAPLGKAFVSAFGWYPFDHVQGLLSDLAGSRSAFEQYLGIAGCAVHRRPTALKLETLLGHDSRRLVARVVQSFGELGQIEHIPALLEFMSDERYATGTTLALARLGCRDESVTATLGELLATSPVDAAGALVHADLNRAARQIEAWCSVDPMAAIAGIEALGDVTYVPKLIEWMEDDRLGPRAGDAFRTITGFDLEYYDLDRESPSAVTGDEHETDPAIRPDAIKVRAFWAHRAPQFDRGEHYLCGRRVGATAAVHDLLHIARGARAKERRFAAYRIACLRPQLPVLETRAFAGPIHEFPGLSSWSNFAPALVSEAE